MVPELNTPLCLQHLFEQQAERTPHARAVVAHDGQLSYEELHRRSTELACYLQSLGIRAEMRVGIAVSRSAAMIIAMLAVLKAGGAYVPIDPSYPPRRFRYLARDSEVRVLLTHRAVPEGVDPELTKIIPLENLWTTIAAAPKYTPDSKSCVSNLAYVIYTSGSTGNPKGVMVSHKSVIHSTLARASYYSPSPGRFLLLSSFSFDSSVAGIFWTLLNGGELWLPPEGTQQNIERISELIRRGRMSHLLLLPSLYKSLLLHAAKNQLTSLQTVIVAGEPCAVDLLAAHRSHLPKTALFNEYGPTEAAVWCTVHRVDAVSRSRVIPIGRPISTTEIHILDEHMSLSEPGEIGEIYIGGPQLARGYLDRPDLTAQKFLPHPFAGTPGARLYRTGDLARYNADGSIDFLGRADEQVKIRGHRIELGEVESALREHPEVQDDVVVVRKDHNNHLQLVAYVVPRTRKLDNDSLRQFLTQILPAYMIPRVYVIVDSLPLNANGKVDRQALPAPGPVDSQNLYVSPRNTTEERLTQIWEELLGISRVGIDDNFFDLGGDSILGLQMVGRANQAGIRLNLTDVIERPTIAKLASAGGMREPTTKPTLSVPGSQ
ncbi:MAG TPA: amino acid adenylation domain-containing protein [Candidatus Angelobacter sp.]|jgi:amino acid adenylation domain-containing protein|nr:amino acid adenylation domain-containing protein [Candidatus Angelobacter sp.]